MSGRTLVITVPEIVIGVSMASMAVPTKPKNIERVVIAETFVSSTSMIMPPCWSGWYDCDGPPMALTCKSSFVVVKTPCGRPPSPDGAAGTTPESESALPSPKMRAPEGRFADMLAPATGTPVGSRKSSKTPQVLPMPGFHEGVQYGEATLPSLW